MSDTQIIPLSKTSWTDISLGSNTGFVTNGTDHNLRYFEAEIKPDDNADEGHILNPGDQFQYNLSGVESVYARGVIGDGRAIVTPGDSLTKAAFIRDFYFEVSRGNIAGFSPVNVPGHDSNINTALSTIGNNTGILQTHSTLADIDSISSDNAADTHDITIAGLDINRDEVTPFTVTLDGQNRVALPTSLYRVNSIFNATGTPTLGLIWVYVNTAIVAGKPVDLTKIRTSMHQTTGKTGAGVSNERDTNTVHTVPNGKTGFIVFGKTTVSDAKALELTFWGRPPGGVFSLQHHIDIKDNNYDYFFKLPLLIPAGSDIEVRASVDVGVAEVSAVYDIVDVAI